MGVTWSKQSRLWRAQGRVGGRQVSIHLSKSRLEAETVLALWESEGKPIPWINPVRDRPITPPHPMDRLSPAEKAPALREAFCSPYGRYRRAPT